MKFLVTFGKVGQQDQWDEEWDVDTDKPEEWVKNDTKNFNAHRKPWEAELEVRRVHVIDARAPSPHKWVEDPKAQLDEVTDALVYRCEHCGISGYYRKGFTKIKRSYLFRPSVFERCDDAMKHNYPKRKVT